MPSRVAARIGRALVVSTLLISTVGTEPARAQPKPPPAKRAETKPLSESLTGDAKEAYEAAKALFRHDDFAGALLKFQQAHDASRDPRLLWNMAVCAKNLRRYTKVLELVESYLQEGGELLADADRTEAEAFSAAVQAFVSMVALTSEPPGAKVFIDDAEVGTTPLAAPLRVDMGTRRIRASKPGFKDSVRTEEIPGGTRLELAIKLEPEVRVARVLVTAGDKDSIAFDGKAQAVGRWVSAVPEGPHRLRVSAPGKKTYESSIELRAGETRTIHVGLEPEVQKGGAPTWVWIAGGAVVVAGAVVGGYFLLKPSAPAPVDGTLDTYQLPNGWRFR